RDAAVEAADAQVPADVELGAGVFDHHRAAGAVKHARGEDPVADAGGTGVDDAAILDVQAGAAHAAHRQPVEVHLAAGAGDQHPGLLAGDVAHGDAVVGDGAALADGLAAVAAGGRPRPGAGRLGHAAG